MKKTSVIESIVVPDVLRLAGKPAPNTGGFFTCPLHPDQNPSAHVVPGGRGWTCFVCGAKGGILHLVVALGHARDCVDAARWLDGRAR